MRVNVTARDIREGKAGQCCLCPIARAVKRHKGWDLAMVGLGLVWRCNRPETAILPIAALQFLRRFDRGRKVRPFKFDLEVSR